MAVSSGSSEIVGASKHAPKKGMVLPFQPLSVAFHHINYYVDMPAVSHSFIYMNSLNYVSSQQSFKVKYLVSESRK